MYIATWKLSNYTDRIVATTSDIEYSRPKVSNYSKRLAFDVWQFMNSHYDPDVDYTQGAVA